MKKALFGVLLCTIVNIASLTAQEEFIKNKTTFGIRGGLDGSYSRSMEGSLNTSVYIGLFAETRLSKRWSLQNELNARNIDFYSISTVEVPILLKYYITDKFSVLAGPGLEFKTRNISNLGYNRPFEINAVVGAQYDITKRFFVDVRYSYGLSSNRSFSSIDNFDIHTVGLGIGFKF